MSNGFKQDADDVRHALTTVSEIVTDAPARLSGEIERAMATASANVSAAAANNTDDLQRAVAAMSNWHQHRPWSRTRRWMIERTLSQVSPNLSAVMRKDAGEAEKTLVATSGAVADNMRQVSGTVTDMPRGSANDAERTLVTASSSATDNLRTVSTSADWTCCARMPSEVERTPTTASSTGRRLLLRQDGPRMPKRTADDRLGLNSHRRAQAGRGRMSSVRWRSFVDGEQALRQTSSEVTRAVATASTEVSNALKQDASDVERALITASTAAKASLKQNATDINTSLSTLSLSVADAIRNSSQSIEQSLDHLLKTTTDAIRGSAQDAEQFARKPVGLHDGIDPRRRAGRRAHPDRGVVGCDGSGEAERDRDRALARPAREYHLRGAA